MDKTIHYMCLFLTAVITCQLHANECRKLFREGALDEALIVCKKMSQTADKNTQEYFWSQFILFDIAHYLGDKEQAYKQLLGLTEYPLDKNAQYELLRRQGEYYRLKKRYSYATSYYSEALSIAEAQKDQEKLAKSYNDIGLMFLKEHDYNESLKYFKQSLSIKKELGSLILMTSTLTNIGLLSYKTGDYEGALIYYKQVEEIWMQLKKTLNNSKMVSNQLIHMYTYFFAVHDKLNNTEQRDAYLELLNNGISELENEEEVLNRYLNEVGTLIESGEYYLAKKIIQKINLEVNSQLDNDALFYYQFAFIEYQFENFDVAKIYAKNSLNAMKEHQTSDNKQNIYHLLYLIEKALKNTDKSLEWHEKYNAEKINELQNITSQDFRLLRYEQNIENSRGNLLQEKLKSALLEKKKNRYYLGLIATLGVFSIVMLLFYYQRKIMIKNNRLLNKDIEKHKAISKNLQKPPVNFKYLLRKKSFQYMVLDEANLIILSNFIKQEEQRKTLLEAMFSSDMAKFIEKGMLAKKIEAVPHQVEKILGLEYKPFFNAQRVISGQYCIVFFCKEDEVLNIDSELNALSQFEFYLNHQDIKDISYTRKLVVDCMNFCLDTWKKRTETSKIEFADQSKIWKINVDDGRLRTRSLDKYFSLDSIPKNPRIAQVIKSCHFMLTLQVLNSDERSKFKFYLDELEQT